MGDAGATPRASSELLAVIAAVGVAAALAAVVPSPEVAGMPALAWTGALAFGVQWAAFVPAYLRQTERFYDLTGSLTYLAVVGACAASAAAPSASAWLAAAMVSVWAARLGSFLALRVHRDGGDGRFDAIKPSAARFLVAWTLQGLWVFLTSLPAQLLILTSPPADAWTAAGAALWAFGFGVEVVADRQKSAFRADPQHRGRFIAHGLWAWSRHPNYFGEIVLWTGIFIMGLGTWSGASWLTALSPAFVALLLTRVSGVPLLEARADARWGGDPAYEAYKAKTPTLVPRPPRRQD